MLGIKVMWPVPPTFFMIKKMENENQISTFDWVVVIFYTFLTITFVTVGIGSCLDFLMINLFGVHVPEGIGFFNGILGGLFGLLNGLFMFECLSRRRRSWKMKPKYKVKERKDVRIKYYTYCPICDREIKGNSASHVDINMKHHLESHKRKKEELKNDKK